LLHEPIRACARPSPRRGGAKRIGNPDLGCDYRKAAVERAERFRPVLAETAHLSTQAAADEHNRGGIATAYGKPWHAMQVNRARRHLAFEAGGSFLGVKSSSTDPEK
jgi:hypothetical protein